MATVTVADAKNHFSDLLRRAEYGGERITVHRHGKAVAVIVSTDDLKRLEALEDASDVRDAEAALKEAAESGTIPLDAVLRKHGLDHLIQPYRATTSRGRRTAPAKRNHVASRGKTGRRRG
jgi:prevent-host-death family protein